MNKFSDFAIIENFKVSINLYSQYFEIKLNLPSPLLSSPLPPPYSSPPLPSLLLSLSPLFESSKRGNKLYILWQSYALKQKSSI